MKQVEEALHQLHARDKEKQARDLAEAQQEAVSAGQAQSSGPRTPQAFAKVSDVSAGSPASKAVSLLAPGALREGLQQPRPQPRPAPEALLGT